MNIKYITIYNVTINNRPQKGLKSKVVAPILQKQINLKINNI